MYQPWKSTQWIYCFYSTIPGSAPIKGEKAWFNYIGLALDLLNRWTTHSQQESALQLPSKVIILDDEIPTRKWKWQQQSTKPSVAFGKLLSRGSSTASKEVDAASLLGLLSVPPSSKDCCVQPSSKSNPSISYWQSTEAAKLFVPKNNETTPKAVEKQIEYLKV